MITRPVKPGTIRAAVPVFIEHLYPLEVERSRAEALRSRLDAIYEQHEEPKVINDAHGMTFVHHPDDYIFFHNSNHAVAPWLEELGCEARARARPGSCAGVPWPHETGSVGRDLKTTSQMRRSVWFVVLGTEMP